MLSASGLRCFFSRTKGCAKRPLALRIFLGCVVLSGSARAEIGELDRFLNPPQIGARTLTRNESRPLQVSAARPAGQTFRVGPRVQEVFRVAVYQPFWQSSWQPDENMVLTLWDSPARKTSLGRDSIPYDRRMWESSLLMFVIDARVDPDRSYYFELTVELSPLRPAEVPREWLLDGRRPGFAGGDGMIEGLGVATDAYPDGEAYIAGKPQDFDLLFQVHVRNQPNRDELYQEAFAHFDLDQSGLEKMRDAVRARDWDRAVMEMLKHFEARSDLVEPHRRTPKPNPQYDTREGDLAAQHKVLLDDRRNTIDLGPGWNYYAWWPERGGVGLTRGGLRKPLAEAYENTGNPKYAVAFNDMLRHFYMDMPSPVRAGMYPADTPIRPDLPPGLAGGSIWSALSLGARMIHSLFYYSIFIDSPCFRTDVRAAYIFNLVEMADVLEDMQGGGNWATQIASALFQFGQRYPEFKKSRKWFKQGFDGLVDNALHIVRSDGVLNEPTSNYHNLVLNRYSGAMVRARELGMAIPAQMNRLVEKMFDFQMYSTLPDGTLPVWGDTFYPMKPELLQRGAELFNRPDMLYVATGGKKGKTPAITSYGFREGGFFYMRSDWSREAHYLALRCGPYGSHGHSDTLSLLASAFGTDVLIDPGVLTYGSPEAQELKATRSHNTITVSDRDAHAGTLLEWITAPGFDFFSARGNGYGGLVRSSDHPDKPELIPFAHQESDWGGLVDRVRHRRRVWFVKPMRDLPGCSIVFDDVSGEVQEPARLRYRFASLPVQSDGNSSVWSSGTHGNLLIDVLGGNGLQLRLTRGIADRGGMTQVPLAVFEEPALPARFTSVLTPFRGADRPRVAVQSLPLQGPPGSQAVWIQMPRTAVLAVLNGDGVADDVAPVVLLLPDGQSISMNGAGLVMRFVQEQARWHPVAIHGVNLASVSAGGANPVREPRPLKMVDRVLGR